MAHLVVVIWRRAIRDGSLFVRRVQSGLWCWRICDDFDVSVGLEDSTAPYGEVDPIEVGQVDQLQTCEKAYEIRNLVNFANFFSMFRWDFEDSTAPYDEADQIEFGQVGQLQTCEKAYEIWNLANFANYLF